jgi:hypothetical protein
MMRLLSASAADDSAVAEAYPNCGAGPFDGGTTVGC